MSVLHAPEENIEMLYRQYASDVYRLALLSTRNQADAEDVVQEVYLRVLQNWHCFRGESQVRTWIWRITRNCLVDAARKRTRSQRLLSKMYTDGCVSSSTPNIDTMVEVEDTFALLSPSQRQVLQLRIVEDLSVAQTAQLLGCTPGKVRIDTHRALNKLKQLPMVK